MVTPTLRALAGPYPPYFPFEGLWFLSDHTSRHLTDAWNRVCDEAIRIGSAEELHAARDDYHAVLLAYLKILDGSLVLLRRFPGEHPDAGSAEQLVRVRDRLRNHYDSLFPRWQTLDDLEAILLERVSLPNDRLKALAAKYPPPPAWYDEPDAPPAAGGNGR